MNILPGRDGLVHISKLGGGRRLDRVDEVVSLGDDLEVRVDDIDPNGKISLTPVGDGDEAPARDDSPAKERSEDRPKAKSGNGSGSREEVSFGDSFDKDLESDFGDLGPAPVSGEGRGGGRRRRGGRR